MTGPFPRALAAALLLAGGLTTFAPAPASGQACLSREEARAAVQSGEVLPLSRIKRQIERAAGEIQGQPRLCRGGGQFVYMLNVLAGGDRIMRIVVDARSGAILERGY